MTGKLPGLLNVDELGLDVSAFMFKGSCESESYNGVDPCGELQVKSAWLGRLQQRKNGKKKWCEISKVQPTSDIHTSQKYLIDALR